MQEGIGEKLGMLSAYAATGISSFIIAFLNGWKLSLVLLSSMPVE